MLKIIQRKSRIRTKRAEDFEFMTKLGPIIVLSIYLYSIVVAAVAVVMAISLAPPH